ncbi:MAG TPA: DUF2079 domain-containing protein [Streptosporangiaceae bacterium]|nr:DUF2079 domain-containing protein [Streptosporangiaceae bacterium]
MSKTTTAPNHLTRSTPSVLIGPLLRVRRVGYAVLALQLVGFLIWSTILYQHFCQTLDFSIYNQAWFLIAHGNLNPFGTVQRFPFWKNHFELVMWPLALLYWVWPHPVTLLWLQDICVVGAEVLAFNWMCEKLLAHRSAKDAAWLASFGLLLFAVNPWTWWSVSFDFHTEPIALVFGVLVARDMANGRRRAWVWAAPLLASTIVASTYLVGLGLGGVLAGRRTRLTGAIMACLGLAYALTVTLLHGDGGSSTTAYSYLAAGAGSTGAALQLGSLLKGIATHPLELVRVMWEKRVDLVANLAPAGLVGLVDIFLLPVVIIVMLTSTLFQGLLFAGPIFQNLPVYVFMPVATVYVVARLLRRRRVPTLILVGVLSAQALGWAAVWGPHTVGQWLRVSSAAAHTLASLQARIPGSDEVIASQGVMGRFTSRADVHSLAVPQTIPLKSGYAWFVITPAQGVELQTPASAMALVGELAGPLHASLVTHANGVWAFRWRPPRGVHAIVVPKNSAPLQAWTAPISAAQAGRTVLTGPVPGWHLTSTGSAGYVASSLEWRERPGMYTASVTLSASGPVNVEVWNDNANVLLARRRILRTTGVQVVRLPVPATAVYRARIFSGWGPFRAYYSPSMPGQRLEVRVWSPGHEIVNVYQAKMIGASQNSSSVKAGS